MSFWVVLGVDLRPTCLQDLSPRVCLGSESKAGCTNGGKGLRLKNVHKHERALVGKKQNKAGHWRSAKVPYYLTNPLHAYSIEDRMKQLGRLDRYQKELAKITRPKIFL